MSERVVTFRAAFAEAAGHERARRLDDAKRIYEAVLRQAPDSALAYHQLGLIARSEGRIGDAIGLFSQAIAVQPAFVEAYCNLGTVLQDCGDGTRAIEAFDTALTLDPDCLAARRLRRHALLYLPGFTPAQRFAEHRAFGARVEPPPDSTLPPPAVDRNPERRLRIGLVSSDFVGHPTGYNALGMFVHRDARAVTLIGYSAASHADAITAQFKANADGWRSVVGLSDRAIAEQVRADAIDILGVLASHFDDNRPRVACYRPAPLQVSLLDGATSGLAAFDYWMGDPVTTPPDTKECFTEKVARVPLVYNYQPIAHAPAAGPPPVLRNGFITFGSVNRPSKISRAAVELWSAVLRALPSSRLLLRYFNWLADPVLQGRLRTGFGAHGIAPDRIGFAPAERGHFETLGDIDIALDTLPFTGATTTFEALSVGVPVVTLAGDTTIERMSASILTAAGLGDLVAGSADAFVAIATALAADHARLAALRASLGARIVASPLCDGPAFARSVETMWRTLWRAWCAGP